MNNVVTIIKELTMCIGGRCNVFLGMDFLIGSTGGNSATK